MSLFVLFWFSLNHRLILWRKKKKGFPTYVIHSERFFFIDKRVRCVTIHSEWWILVNFDLWKIFICHNPLLRLTTINTTTKLPSTLTDILPLSQSTLKSNYDKMLHWITSLVSVNYILDALYRHPVCMCSGC